MSENIFIDSDHGCTAIDPLNVAGIVLEESMGVWRVKFFSLKPPDSSVWVEFADFNDAKSYLSYAASVWSKYASTGDEAEKHVNHGAISLYACGRSGAQSKIDDDRIVVTADTGDILFDLRFRNDGSFDVLATKSATHQGDGLDKSILVTGDTRVDDVSISPGAWATISRPKSPKG